MKILKNIVVKRVYNLYTYPHGVPFYAADAAQSFSKLRIHEKAERIYAH
jgi:hypothetical protein